MNGPNGRANDDSASGYRCRLGERRELQQNPRAVRVGSQAHDDPLRVQLN